MVGLGVVSGDDDAAWQCGIRMSIGPKDGWSERSTCVSGKGEDGERRRNETVEELPPDSALANRQRQYGPH